MPESITPPEVPEAYSDTPQRHLRWIRCQQIGAHTLAAAAFVVPLYNTQPSEIFPLLRPEPVCAAPSEASRAAIRKLIFDPQNIHHQAIKQAKNLPQADRNAFVQQTVAQALSVHVHNAAPVIDSLSSGQDFKTQKKTLMTFFNKFGITEVGAAKSKDLVKDWEIVAEQSSQDEQLVMMLTLANTLSELPEEYIRATGITRVVFAQNDTDNRAHLAYVAKNAKGIASKTIVVNILQQLQASVFRHEFYHKIDEKNCGKKAADHDQHIATLAKPPQGTHGLTVQDYMARVEEINETIDWTAPNCTSQVIQANITLNELAKQTVFATPYAKKNIVELKAELFSGTDRLSPRLNKIRDQLIDMLARMRDYNQPVAEYLALLQTSRLTYPDLQTDTDEPNIQRCE